MLHLCLSDKKIELCRTPCLSAVGEAWARMNGSWNSFVHSPIWWWDYRVFQLEQILETHSLNFPKPGTPSQCILELAIVRSPLMIPACDSPKDILFTVKSKAKQKQNKQTKQCPWKISVFNLVVPFVSVYFVHDFDPPGHVMDIMEGSDEQPLVLYLSNSQHNWRYMDEYSLRSVYTDNVKRWVVSRLGMERINDRGKWGRKRSGHGLNGWQNHKRIVKEDWNRQRQEESVLGGWHHVENLWVLSF